MNNVPPFFVDYCQNVEIPQKKAQSFWLAVWENATEEFLIWLIKKGGLAHNQLLELDRLFDRFINDENMNQNIIDAVTPILNVEQKKKAINQLATCFTSHLDRFYSDSRIKKENH